MLYDIKRADAFLDAAIQQKGSVASWRFKLKFQTNDCERGIARSSKEHRSQLSDVISALDELYRLAERIESYLEEEDFVEDDFAGLKEIRVSWLAQRAILEEPEAYLRGALAAEREALVSELKIDLDDGNIRANVYKLILTVLEGEQLLSREQPADAAEVGAIIESLSAAREVLRAAPTRPPIEIFNHLSSVVAALKQHRRNLSAGVEDDGVGDRLSLSDRSQPVSDFYHRSLLLWSSVRRSFRSH